MENNTNQQGVLGLSFDVWRKEIDKRLNNPYISEKDKKIITSISLFFHKTGRISVSQAKILLAIDNKKQSEKTLNLLSKSMPNDEDWEVVYRTRKFNGKTIEEIVEMVIPYWKKKEGNNFSPLVEHFDKLISTNQERPVPPKRITLAMLNHKETKEVYADLNGAFQFSVGTSVVFRKNSFSTCLFEGREKQQNIELCANAGLLIVMKQKHIINPTKLGTNTKVYEIMPKGRFKFFDVPEKGLRLWRKSGGQNDAE